MKEIVSKEEAVRLALARLGDVPATDLVQFIEQEYGVKLDPRFLSLVKASLRAREQQAHFRSQARNVAGLPLAAPPQAA